MSVCGKGGGVEGGGPERFWAQRKLSSRNAPFSGEERCVTTLKTAV